VIYELASKLNKPLKSFRSVGGIEEIYPLDSYPQALFQLYSASVSRPPRFRSVFVESGSMRGERIFTEGAGLIQLHLGTLKNSSLTHTHYGHWNEAGAKAKSRMPIEDCNWKELARLSRRIQNRIRALATNTLCSRPVLRNAELFVLSGGLLIHNNRACNLDGDTTSQR
jgi:hypothetical protein